MPAPWPRGAQLRIVGELHGSQCINVMHFATNTVVNDGPPLDAILLQLAQAMLQCAVDVLLPAVTQDYRLIKVDARQVHPVSGDPIEAVAPANSVGQLGVTSVSFAASLAQVRTGGGGRSGRGRMFLPPPGEAQIAQSDIDGPTLALIAAFLACVAGKFIGAGATEAWRLGVLSQKKINDVLPPFDNRFREALTLAAVSTVAVMRSRKKGVGA